MATNKIISVWGSPGSGKTTISLKLGEKLTQKKRNVLIIFSDNVCPMINAVLPNEKENNTSLGNLLASPSITQKMIEQYCITLRRNPYIAFLGYLNGDTVNTYPEYTKERAVEFLTLAAYLAEFVIVDCTGDINGNILSAISLEMADERIRISAANPKSVSYFSAWDPILSDRKYMPEKHIKITNVITENQDEVKYQSLLGGCDFKLPHLARIQDQFDDGRILSPLDEDKLEKDFMNSIDTLAQKLLLEGEADD